MHRAHPYHWYTSGPSWNDPRQARRRLWRAIPRGALSLDTNYLVDAFGAKLSEVGRLAYVRRCIRSKMSVEWAMCQGDIDVLDLKKVGDELRASKKYPRYLEGVKPGMYASITEDVVSAVWAKPGAAIPTMVFGVPLK